MLLCGIHSSFQPLGGLNRLHLISLLHFQLGAHDLRVVSGRWKNGNGMPRSQAYLFGAKVCQPSMLLCGIHSSFQPLGGLNWLHLIFSLLRFQLGAHNLRVVSGMRVVSG
jgi:hypothetical protein